MDFQKELGKVRDAIDKINQEDDDYVETVFQGKISFRGRRVELPKKIVIKALRSAEHHYIEREKYSESQKPPIGIKPEYLCVEERVKEISEAFERYNKAGVEFPKAWTVELGQKVDYLKARGGAFNSQLLNTEK